MPGDFWDRVARIVAEKIVDRPVIGLGGYGIGGLGGLSQQNIGQQAAAQANLPAHQAAHKAAAAHNEMQCGMAALKVGLGQA